MDSKNYLKDDVRALNSKGKRKRHPNEDTGPRKSPRLGPRKSPRLEADNPVDTTATTATGKRKRDPNDDTGPRKSLRLDADAPDATATIATDIADGLLRRRPDHHCLSSYNSMLDIL